MALFSVDQQRKVQSSECEYFLSFNINKELSLDSNEIFEELGAIAVL
jgi:hypothetical protein